MRITETKTKDVVKNRNLDLVATLLEMVKKKKSHENELSFQEVVEKRRRA